MDYSNEFCKMCFKSSELQQLIDTIPTRKIIMERISKDKFVSSNENRPGGNFFWLPSESQLERLMEGSTEEEYYAFIRNSYHEMDKNIPLNIFSSFERYRLAFIMKNKYTKYWVSNSWVRLTDDVEQ